MDEAPWIVSAGGMHPVVEDLQRNLQKNVDLALVRTRASHLAFYEHLPDDVLRGSIERTVRAVMADLEADTNSVFPGGLAALGAQRTHYSSAQGDMLEAVRIGFDVVGEHVHEAFHDQYEIRLWWETRYRQLFCAGAVALSYTLLVARERLLDERTEELRRVQLPIVPLSDGILLVPLVGTIDAQRGADLKERVLAAVAQHSAHAVLLDITGVPSIDEAAAQQLLDAARAIALLGSRASFVGIGPNLARQIVASGFDLGKTPTFGTLEDGLVHALFALGKRIADV